LMEETEQDAAIIGRMKQFASWFTHGVPGGAVLRKSIYEVKSSAGVLAAVDAFFAAQVLRAPETEELLAAGV
jgi:tRNA-dihydrouridine synthase B